MKIETMKISELTPHLVADFYGKGGFELVGIPKRGLGKSKKAVSLTPPKAKSKRAIPFKPSKKKAKISK